LGQHAGLHQILDLGDGNGPSTCLIRYNLLRLNSCSVPENETAVIRYNYGDPALGTCQETIQGGNHFRYWVQNGPQRNSSAVFMAISYEHSLQSMSFSGSVLLDPISIGVNWDVEVYTDDAFRSRINFLISEPSYRIERV